MKRQENQKSGITLDGLANMVAKGFESVTNDVGELKSDVNVLKSDVNVLKSDVGELKIKMSKMEYQIDEVYDILKRFEENDILNLQKRVQILEKAVRALAANQPPK